MRRATTSAVCRREPPRRSAPTPPASGPIYVVVEKILGRGRSSRRRIGPIHGTTGYEFAAIVNGLFVDRRREREMDDAYSGFAYGRRTPIVFDDIVYRSKKQVLHEIMSGDINSLGHRLNRFSERNRHFRDFTLYSLISMLKEVIACFPVYRSYITQTDPVTEPDRRYIALAMQWAKRRARDTPPIVFDFTERLLLSKDATTDARGRGGAGGVRREIPAADRTGRGQGHRGLGLLRLQPAALTERSRRRPDQIRRRSGHRASLAGRPPAPLACRPVGHGHPRHQAGRRRPRASQRPVRNARRMAPGHREVAGAEPALQARGPRPDRARCERGVFHLSNAGRRLAVRSPGRGRIRGSVEGVSDQGAARSQGPHQLAESG